MLRERYAGRQIPEEYVGPQACYDNTLLASKERPNLRIERRKHKRHEPISEDQQEIIMVPKVSLENSLLLSDGRLVGRRGVFPQEAIIPFPETVVVEFPLRNKNILSKKMKLAIAAGLVVGHVATVAGAGVLLSVNESNRDMQNAQVSSTEFIKNNEQMLKNKEIGISFDQYDYTSTGDALKALDFFHDQLGITHYRIKPGDMQNDSKVVNGKIEYDFSKYKPIMDKLMSYEGIFIIPNLGVKEFCWPEQRAPDQYKQDLIDASEGSGAIKPDNVLAKEAINYENSFVNFLVANYTDKQLNNIEGFEFENEPYNKYGDYAVRMENVKQSIENNMKTFPKKVKYLVNSAGFFNVDEITSNFKDLISAHPELKNRLIMGIDYYRDVGSVDTPFGTIDPMNWPIVGKNADEIVWDKSLSIFGNKLTNLAQSGKDVGFETQATEDGIGPWGGYEDNKSQFPADLTNVQYSIERVSKFADPNKEFTIGAWKLGDLYNERNNSQYSHNIKEIFDLIRKINTKDIDANVNINSS